MLINKVNCNYGNNGCGENFVCGWTSLCQIQGDSIANFFSSVRGVQLTRSAKWVNSQRGQVSHIRRFHCQLGQFNHIRWLPRCQRGQLNHIRWFTWAIIRFRWFNCIVHYQSIQQHFNESEVKQVTTLNIHVCTIRH